MLKSCLSDQNLFNELLHSKCFYDAHFENKHSSQYVFECYVCSYINTEYE